MAQRQGGSVKIQSLARADTILAVIASATGSRARLSDIATASRLHKNTTFSLLDSLCGLGFVRQLPTREYTLGHRMYELARTSEAGMDIVQLARPLMLRMVGAINESTSLGIPTRSDTLIVSTVESSHGVRGARFQGRHSPFHASALGKAILAFLPEADRAAILSTPDLPQLTTKTLKTRAALQRQLEEVRSRGFAIALEEEEIGANAVAAPVLGPMTDVLGAIAVWGPTSRLTPDRLARIGANLVGECRAMTFD